MDAAGLILLIALVGLLGFWLNTLTVRDLAQEAARNTCRLQNLQLLDGTVAFHRCSFGRSPSGWLTLRRIFLFAYSADGVERRTGFIIMSGNHIDQVGL